MLMIFFYIWIFLTVISLGLMLYIRNTLELEKSVSWGEKTIDFIFFGPILGPLTLFFIVIPFMIIEYRNDINEINRIKNQQRQFNNDFDHYPETEDSGWFVEQGKREKWAEFNKKLARIKKKKT
jgi:hypothetical protein